MPLSLPRPNFKKDLQWTIENTQRYYYLSGRNHTTYVEITFWYSPVSFERKETKREETIQDGQTHKLPEWAKCITFYNKRLNCF